MKLQQRPNTSQRNRVAPRAPFADRDLAGRPEAIVPKSLDARLIAGEAPVRDRLADLWLELANQKSVLMPILKRMARWSVSQFAELSRISARPAALAKLVSAQSIRSQPMIVRVILVPLASLFIALGVAMQVTSGLGVGPGDMVASGISAKTGLTFGNSAIIMSGLIALVGTLLGRAPRIATLVNVAMIAFSIDLLMPFLEIEGGFLSRALHFSMGLWSVGVGLGCLLHARLGIGTHEALSLAIFDRTGIPVKKVRLGQELTWMVLGMSLGSQFGIGTVAVALFIGPAIAGGTRMVGKVLRALSEATQAPEVAAHVGDVGF